MKLGMAGAVAVFVLTMCGTASASPTYAANCGNAFYLEYKGDSYSSGCMGGSLNIHEVYWTSWGSQAAHGAGTSLYRWAPQEGAWDTYKSPGRVRLYRPQRCNDHGVTRWFFSRATIGIYFYEGNPVGKPKGWASQAITISAYEGNCHTAERGLREAGGRYGSRNYVGAAMQNEFIDAESVPKWLGGFHAFD